jgi:hypothetical protein
MKELWCYTKIAIEYDEASKSVFKCAATPDVINQQNQQIQKRITSVTQNVQTNVK